MIVFGSERRSAPTTVRPIMTWQSELKDWIANLPASIRDAHTRSANHRLEVEASDL